MIKNIIFDIGNVILNFDLSYVLPKFTKNTEDQKFILENIINSPEWLGYSLIDTGYLKKEDAVELVKDRTNHVKDELIEYFWNNYNDYSLVNEEVLKLIKQLKKNNYNTYLLSNINPYTVDSIKSSGLFNIVDGSVLSYEVHKIKPYIGIYNELINKYNLNVNECLFIDDNQKNIDTAVKLGITASIVKPDDYNSIVEVLKNNNIVFKWLLNILLKSLRCRYKIYLFYGILIYI